jgi:hypothetical protein
VSDNYIGNPDDLAAIGAAIGQTAPISRASDRRDVRRAWLASLSDTGTDMLTKIAEEAIERAEANAEALKAATDLIYALHQRIAIQDRIILGLRERTRCTIE